MKRWAALAVALAAVSAVAAPLPRIVVAPGNHLLATGDGQPFFWLGDTAWELIHRLTPDEIRYYFRERARQGFTVIQTVVLAEFDGIRTPTPDGLLPFADGDPTRPDAVYFDRVAWTVDEAARAGLYVALLPTWGDKVTAPWGTGPRLFATPAIARAYGRFLGARLRGRSNLVWMLGGDRPARLTPAVAAPGVAAGWAADTDWTPIWAALAAGLREGGGGSTLIAYHPQGGAATTAVLLPGAAWLDLDGIQSGHGGGHDVPVWEWIARDYAQARPRPTLDLEPNYEDHPVNPWPTWVPATGRFSAYDVRKQVYRSVLAGAAGVTYGHHAVWQFASGRNPPINAADRDWRDALHRPGAEAMHYLRDLIMSRPPMARMPDAALVVGDAGDGGRHVVAARGDGYALVYVPQSDQRVTLDLARLGGTGHRAWWYDPRTGAARDAGVIPIDGTFTSPSYGPDWVLVLDDAARGFGPPGLAPATSQPAARSSAVRSAAADR